MTKQDSAYHDDDDKFDYFLTKQLQQSQPYLHDDNFTVQMMSKLPAPKKLSVVQERLIILVPLVIISLLVFSQISLLAIAIKLMTLLVNADIKSLLSLGMLIAATIISGACFWFAKQVKLI